ncbi:MAG: hypothetical protein M1831_007610 [Alyxoria varia]|nr:MAG: hypothetical protein M1831_007610 [Alyxoria varia]
MTDRSMWQRTKSGSKGTFDKLWGYADKLGEPANKLSNKLGAEAFWPTTLDKESEKAARILRSFSKDGFYEEEFRQSIDGPRQKQKVIKHIPHEVVRNAKGLAIFTTMRTGLWMSGAGGSGVLVGRQDDGTWSQPVGIMLHTAGLGFLVGVDIYDCVLVLNTEQALNAFSRWRCIIGGEMSAVAGPTGVGGILDTEIHRRQAPIFSYLKSRGFYAGVQIDGTVVVERTDENERFYGQKKVSAKDILAGRAHSGQWEIRMLIETLRVAQGEKYIKRSLLPTDAPPADYDIVEEGHVFGVPDREDPDPYGVLALEKEGLQIKEAGTKMRASSEQFDFKPVLTSPVFETFRKSTDSGINKSPLSPRSSWRRSNLTTTPQKERTYVTSDVSTQTEFDSPSVTSPRTGRPLTDSPDANSTKGVEKESLGLVNPADRHVEGLGISVDESRELAPTASAWREKDSKEVEEGLATADNEETKKVPTSVISPVACPPPQALDGQQEPESPISPPSTVSSPGKQNPVPIQNEQNEYEQQSNHEEVDTQDDVIVHEVRQAPQVITKARMVNVPKRIPPKLPDRNPGRASRGSAARAVQIGSASGPASESDATSTRSLSIRSEEVGAGATIPVGERPISDTGVHTVVNGTQSSDCHNQVDAKSQEAASGGQTPATSATEETSTYSSKRNSSLTHRPTVPEDYFACSTKTQDTGNSPATEINSFHNEHFNQASASPNSTAIDSNPPLNSTEVTASSPSPSINPHSTVPSSTPTATAPTTNGIPNTTILSSTSQDTSASRPTQNGVTSATQPPPSPTPPPPRSKVRDAALRFESSSTSRLSPPPRSRNRQSGSRSPTPRTPSELKNRSPVNGAPAAVPAPAAGAFSPPSEGTAAPFPPPSPSLPASRQDADTSGKDQPTDFPKVSDNGIGSVRTEGDGYDVPKEGGRMVPRISLANIRGGLDSDDDDENGSSRSMSRSRSQSRGVSPVRIE